MSKLERKNLVVDADKLRELARLRRMSESALVRQLVDFALAAEEVGAAMAELHARGGIDDVFGRVPREAAAESGDEGDEQWRATKSRIPAS